MPARTKSESTPPQTPKVKSKPSKKAPPPPRPLQPAPAPPVQMRNTSNSTSNSNGGVARPRSLINMAQGQNQRTHVSFYSYTVPDDPPINQNGRNTGDSFERNGNNRNQQSGDVLQIDNWEALDSLPQILGLVFKDAHPNFKGISLFYMFLKTKHSNNPRFKKYSTKVSRTLGSTLGSIRASRVSGRQRPRLPPPPPPKTGNSFGTSTNQTSGFQNSNQPCKYKVYGSTPSTVTSTVTSPSRNINNNFGIPLAGSMNMTHSRPAPPPPPERFGSLQRNSNHSKRAAPPVPDLAPVTEVKVLQSH